MLHAAKLLHSRGFHVTFVNTDYNHSFPPRFDFESIPDGLPPSDNIDSTQDIPLLCDSIPKNLLAPFRDLVHKLNDCVALPRVSCILSDAAMAFTLDVARELRIPDALFLTPSACANLAFLSYPVLVEAGLVPLKSSSYLTNGYLETVVDCIPGLNKNIRLKDLPTFVRTTDPNDVVFNFCVNELARIPEGLSLIMNTFDSLEQEALTSLSSLCPNLLTVGPLVNLLHDQTPDQLIEFAWGLAKSEKPFLWIIRPDLVSCNSKGTDLSVPVEFVEETKGRGMLASLSNGVPMICWPFFADQQTNCFYACKVWEVGIEIGSEVKKEEVEKLVREVMDGEKGNEMKMKAMEWKLKAEESTKPGGSSFQNLNKLIEILLKNTTN
ncbi:UDP-glycosyltransferase 85A8 [Linum grandiflorum]